MDLKCSPINNQIGGPRQVGTPHLESWVVDKLTALFESSFTRGWRTTVIPYLDSIEHVFSGRKFFCSWSRICAVSISIFTEHPERPRTPPRI